ncbi:hypothetical protein PybrP1_004457 [[Pythium] brassicae (nom. inval.)]|nr:hypothetical protein PybrP1_004457 [[Pythium] brassicae (nom. inval.)]
MATDEEFEDGEILEEGEEPEPSCSTTAAAPPPLPVPSKPQPPLPKSAPPPLPPVSAGVLGVAPPPRKRLHSAMQEQHRSARPAPSSSYSSSATRTSAAGYQQSSSYATPPVGSAPLPPRREFESYSEDLIIKFPRQVARSNVLLDFACWMEHARARLRLNVEDVQDLIENVALRGADAAAASSDGDVEMGAASPPPPPAAGRVSPYLMDALVPNKPLPTKVCVVLLGNVHPSVLQRYRSTLGFFNASSSVPCVLSKTDETKRMEAPLPELLYRFPRPPVNTKGMAAEELFYGHELTFLMRHSYGYSDEVTVQPSGSFVRKSQPLGGTWELDGDLLHLKWRHQAKASAASAAAVATDDAVAAAATPAAADGEEDNAFTLDVLVSEDDTMHYFNTDPLVDKTYARKTPEHLVRRRGDTAARSIRLSLVKAVVVDVARHPDGSVVVPKKATGNASADSEMTETTDSVGTAASESSVAAVETTDNSAGDSDDNDDASSKLGIDYYVLSEQELIQHGFPVSVEDEQELLDAATNGCTRDRFVQTRARSEEPAAADGDSLYALDCEMCETDIGMELTRVTVVDQHHAVVYDQLVKPQSTIINYLTEFSGITPEMLADEHVCALADVQRALLTRFLFADTVLVGHSLTSDLRALRVVHLRVADSAILYPHPRGFPFRTSLKQLTKTYLRRDIQLQAQQGHDSAEDAISAMQLVQLKLRHGPLFGIPETAIPLGEGAFDSLAHKVDAHGKRMSLFRLACVQRHGDDTAAATATPDKPWQLFASGDLTAQARSPYVHARSFVSAKKPGTAQPVATVDELLDWAALATSVERSLAADDVCWVEIDGPSDHVVTSDFLFRHDAWMQQQRAHCVAVDAFLQDVRARALPERTLLLVVPQSDLTMLRYLKGLRTRAKWRDAAPGVQWTDDMQAAVTDAFRGAMDSCVFLTQK